MLVFVRMVLIAAAGLEAYDASGSLWAGVFVAFGLWAPWWYWRASHRRLSLRDEENGPWGSWPGNTNNPRPDDSVEAAELQDKFESEHPPTTPTQLDRDFRDFVLGTLTGLAMALVLDLSWPWLIGMPIAAGVVYVAVDRRMQNLLIYGPEYPFDD